MNAYLLFSNKKQKKEILIKSQILIIYHFLKVDFLPTLINTVKIIDHFFPNKNFPKIIFDHWIRIVYASLYFS